MKQSTKTPFFEKEDGVFVYYLSLRGSYGIFSARGGY